MTTHPTNLERQTKHFSARPNQTIEFRYPVSNHLTQHPVILTFKAIGGLMPAAKKTAAPKKKAPAKKAAPKKAAPKKAAPKKAAPKKFAPVSVYMLTNSGEQHVTFSDEAQYKAAIDCMSNAPKESGGFRNPPTFTIVHDGGPLSFATLDCYEIKS